MSISGITSNLFQPFPLGMIRTAGASPGAPQAAAAGGLFDALMKALTQSGALTSTTAASSAAGTATTTTDATATSSIAAGSTSASSATSTSASSTRTPQQAMQAFIQNLVSALQQAQGTGGAAATSLGVARAHGLHGRGHGGRMGAALQDLINEVDATNSTTAAATIPAGTSTSSATSTPAVASLQQSFQNLVSSLGGSSTASLSNFLTNFANDLSGMSLVGNLVNTQA